MNITNAIKCREGGFLSEICAILEPFSLWLGSKPACDVGRRSFKRYKLAELMEGATPENMQALNAKTAWALEGTAVGKELI